MEGVALLKYLRTHIESPVADPVRKLGQDSKVLFCGEYYQAGVIVRESVKQDEEFSSVCVLAGTGKKAYI